MSSCAANRRMFAVSITAGEESTMNADDACHGFRTGAAMPRPPRWATRASAALAVPCALLAAGAAFAQTYRVYAHPIESPDHGERTLVTAPHDPLASPFGWHDTDGVPGAEYTTLRGNNVHVYLDVNNDNLPDGPGPNGGSGLVFDHAVDFAGPPSSYYDALATNAFYWTNRMHDIFLRHGFTPSRGNMQANTYGLGGIGNDPLKVEIAKGGGTNNISYALTADGTSPSVRHYVWNATTPNRETSFDAGGMTWAYSVVMYHRLAGPACMGYAETPYTGYADFLSILLTADFHTATPTTRRGMVTYLLGQPVDGAGIRGFPYSTDLAVFPRTYANLPSLASPHGVGTVWAAALWDLAWAMVGRHGASHDLLDGNGAENRMLRLVIESMDTLACPAGFVSARDRILAADQSLHAGQDRCLIWQAFARRGIGFGAVEGSPSSNSDQTPSFLLPADCNLLFAHGFE